MRLNPSYDHPVKKRINTELFVDGTAVLLKLRRAQIRDVTKLGQYCSRLHL